MSSSDEKLLSRVRTLLKSYDAQSRKMFGGIGIFSEQIMFSMIYDGVLYLRSTEDIATLFSYDSVQFQHPSSGSKMPYWSVPEEIINNETEFIDWAESAFNLAKSLKKK